MNYYNENDPKAAAWLRELIRQGLIPLGRVDERSIVDVKPEELREYTQCHFFAGIGGWVLALDLAGFPRYRRVWTGSCPCQPFSSAGKGLGEADERHLWPAWFKLIRECGPDTLFGEQVASKAALAWFDGVSSDLEAAGYAVAATDLCSAGVGSPHIRQRLHWMADSLRGRRDERGGQLGEEPDSRSRELELAQHRVLGGVALSDGGQSGDRELQSSGQYGQLPEDRGACGVAHLPSSRCRGPLEKSEADPRNEARVRLFGQDCGFGGMADTPHPKSPRLGQFEYELCGSASDRMAHHHHEGFQGRGLRPDCDPAQQSPWAGGFDVLHCTDGKSRRVESGTFPLAHGVSGRVGLLRGYGNAINPYLAAAFVQACEEARCL